MGKAYERLPLTGGLLSHDTQGNLAPKPLAVSNGAPVTLKQEHQYQVALFDFLKVNSPRMPYRLRRITKGKREGQMEQVPDYGSPAWAEYVAHPLYILTRIRAFPNGGHRHKAVAGQMRAEGVRPGAFDVFLDEPRRGFHGYRAELKAGANGPEPEQLEELAHLRARGYFAHFYWTDAEVIASLLWYLELPARALSGLPPERFSVGHKGGHDARCPDCDWRLTWWFR